MLEHNFKYKSEVILFSLKPRFHTGLFYVVFLYFPAPGNAFSYAIANVREAYFSLLYHVYAVLLRNRWEQK